MELDWFSTLVGFVVGGLTGAVGTYLGDKYTDIRRENQAKRAQAKQWFDIENRYKDLITEMRKDLTSGHGGKARILLAVPQRLVGVISEPSLIYDPAEHPNLSVATQHFVQLGYITDITENPNTPMFRIQEHFVDLLINR